MTKIQLLQDELRVPLRDTKHVFAFIQDKVFFEKPSRDKSMRYLNSVKEILEGINRSIETYIATKDDVEVKQKRPRITANRQMRNKPIEEIEELEILCGMLTEPIKKPSVRFCTAGAGTNVYKKGDKFIIYFVPVEKFHEPFRVEYPKTSVDLLKKISFKNVEFN